MATIDRDKTLDIDAMAERNRRSEEVLEETERELFEIDVQIETNRRALAGREHSAWRKLKQAFSS